VHAPSATPDGKGGVIVIFNMNPGLPTEGWNQIMTLPRRLTLATDDVLRIEPAGDIESLRYDHRRIEGMDLPASQELVLEGIAGNAMELNLEIDPENAPMVELTVLRSPNKEEHTRISFFKDRGFRVQQPSAQPGAVLASGDPVVGRHGQPRPTQLHASLLTLDTSYSSTLPDALSRAPETAPLVLEPGEPLRLRVFIDRSVVEVFANGKQCVAARVYPGRDDSTGISLRAQGDSAKLVSLDAWQMKDIYAKEVSPI
jgi:beta-fructofuranosidase